MSEKTFIVALAAEGIGIKTIRVAGEKVQLLSEGYKITKDGESVFVSSYNHVRYIQEEKSISDNPTGREEPGQVFEPRPSGLMKEAADKAKTFLVNATDAAIPRFTSLQEMAKEFYKTGDTNTALQIHAINSFVEFIESRLRSTMFPRR